MKRFASAWIVFFIITALMSTAAYATQEVILTVSLEADLMYNNNVGNDWDNTFFIRYNEVDYVLLSGNSIRFHYTVGDQLTISSHITETDDLFEHGYPETTINYSTIRLYEADIFDGRQKQHTQEIVVTEDAGTFEGNSARWETIFSFSSDGVSTPVSSPTTAEETNGKEFFIMEPMEPMYLIILVIVLIVIGIIYRIKKGLGSRSSAPAEDSPQQSTSIFKRILSWVVLIAVSLLTLLLQALIVGFAVWLVLKFSNGTILSQIILYLLIGGNALWILIMLFIHAPTWSISASESICGSRKGLRYKILSYYYIASSAISVITGFTSQQNLSHFLVHAIILVYFILMLVHIKDMVFTNTERNIIHIDLSKDVPASSSQLPPPVTTPATMSHLQAQAKDEPIYLMERDDGVLVRVPASKLGEFDPSKTEPSEEEKKFAAEMAERLIKRKYELEQKSLPSAPQQAAIVQKPTTPTRHPILTIALITIAAIVLLSGIALIYHFATSSKEPAQVSPVYIVTDPG